MQDNFDQIMKRKALIRNNTFKRWEMMGFPLLFMILHKALRKCEVHVLAPHTRGAKKNENMNGIIVDRFDYAPELA